MASQIDGTASKEGQYDEPHRRHVSILTEPKRLAPENDGVSPLGLVDVIRLVDEQDESEGELGSLMTMALADYDLTELRKRIYEAYQREDPIMEELREQAKTLASLVRPVRPYSVNAVSFVSSDGGDNRLCFNPAVIELVRVVDSRGNQCAVDAIASNTSADDLDERVKAGSPLLVEPLRRLCEDLDIQGIGQLSYLLGGLAKGKSTGAIRCYRDIVEWAVLYDLVVNHEWGSDTVIVRDGLLRTKSFKRELFPRIDAKIREGVERRCCRNVNISIVGVAKQSAVLSRLAVALELEGVFHKPFPCYAQVPKEIEEKCYNFDRTWLDTYESILADNQTRDEGDAREPYLYQSMGQMYLVKFGDRAFDPVWPVDIASWQVADADRIIGQLTVDAQYGFPIPDYPMCIQKAHDYAKVNGIEVSILQDILFDGITRKLNDPERERVLRMRYLGENLASRRYKNA